MSTIDPTRGLPREQLHDLLDQRDALPDGDPHRDELAWQAVMGVCNVIAGCVEAAEKALGGRQRMVPLDTDMLTSRAQEIVFESLVDRADTEQHWPAYVRRALRKRLLTWVDDTSDEAIAGLTQKQRSILRAVLAKTSAWTADPTPEDLAAGAELVAEDKQRWLDRKHPDLDDAGRQRMWSSYGWNALDDVVELYERVHASLPPVSLDAPAGDRTVGDTIAAATDDHDEVFSARLRGLLQLSLADDELEVLERYGTADWVADPHAEDRPQLQSVAKAAWRTLHGAADVADMNARDAKRAKEQVKSLDKRVRRNRAKARSQVGAPHVQWAMLSDGLAAQLQGDWPAAA